MIANRSYDCVVIGAGPGGGAAAALVAEQGFSTLLLERDKMPRFHVGESLMPETYWIFERLGILHELDKIVAQVRSDSSNGFKRCKLVLTRQQVIDGM